MADIKPMEKIASRWQKVSSVSQQEYTEGVMNPRKDWATATQAAAANYAKGVQTAISNNSFANGVKNAGSEKWAKGATTKGPSRWAEGIRLAGDAYAQGFAPYREVIARTVLPARGPKGDPQNINRVSVIANALHKEKVSRSTGR